MQYRINPRNGDAISALGYGCMRFTRSIGINQEKAETELEAAFKNGVNYFDTAYIYPGSEAALGKFLAKGYRDKVFVATKLPYKLCRTLEDVEKIFNEQKTRLQTSYLDYYLIHMLSDTDAWEKLKSAGIETWIAEKKASKEIRNIGFSYHGGTDGFKRLVDCYDWDFCQIQLNYLDDVSQAGIAGLKYAAEKNLPVIIMEPLRGGRLCKLAKHEEELFAAVNPDRKAADWGLRWLWNMPEVTCVLSGMNDVEQIRENTETAETALPGLLTDEETAVYSRVKETIMNGMRVPCTGCGYCMPCPAGVDIPSCFAAYNTRAVEGFLPGMMAYVTCTSMKEKPASASACIGCGRCEKKCPQGLLIRDFLDETKAVMEGPAYRIGIKLLKKLPFLMKWSTTML